jgi:UDP-glucuronate decarboxylase
MTKTILITGGGGFIGKNLIRSILNSQTASTIVVLDIFRSSRQDEFVHFVQSHGYSERILLYTYDITNDVAMKGLVNDLADNGIHMVDEIYHLASLASPPLYKKYPLETLDVGYIGSKNVLDLARHYLAKVLFTSTSEVYGDALISPQSESYYGNVNTVGERSCYDESKRIAETLCYTYAGLYGLDVKIARIFNTYGPHMLLEDGRIITEVIRNLKEGTPLVVYGDGRQTRSCCFVEDTVTMLRKLMASDASAPVNVGNDEERTILETVEAVERVWLSLYPTRSRLKMVFRERTQNDPLQRRPCLAFQKEVLGETVYTPFEEGIRRTIAYFMGSPKTET